MRILYWSYLDLQVNAGSCSFSYLNPAFTVRSRISCYEDTILTQMLRMVRMVLIHEIIGPRTRYTLSLSSAWAFIVRIIESLPDNAQHFESKREYPSYPVTTTKKRMTMKPMRQTNVSLAHGFIGHFFFLVGHRIPAVDQDMTDILAS